MGEEEEGEEEEAEKKGLKGETGFLLSPVKFLNGFCLDSGCHAANFGPRLRVVKVDEPLPSSREGISSQTQYYSHRFVKFLKRIKLSWI